MEEKITITKKPEINLEFNIQKKGSSIFSISDKYDISKFAEFISQIPADKWTDMSVAKHNNYIADEAIRSSKTNKFVYIRYADKYYPGYEEDYHCSKNNLYCNGNDNGNGDNNWDSKNARHFSIKYKHKDIDVKYINPKYIAFDKNSIQNGFSNFTLIKYDTGDHFDEFHYDTLHCGDNGQMIGTALLFPPADISRFTGGDLVFKVDEEDQELTYTIHPSKFTEWTLVTFGHLLHKCMPVESGTRYVLKANIWSSFPNLIPYNTATSFTEITKVLENFQDNNRKIKLESLKTEITYKITELFVDELKAQIAGINKVNIDVEPAEAGKLIIYKRNDPNKCGEKCNGACNCNDEDDDGADGDSWADGDGCVDSGANGNEANPKDSFLEKYITIMKNIDSIKKEFNDIIKYSPGNAESIDKYVAKHLLKEDENKTNSENAGNGFQRIYFYDRKPYENDNVQRKVYVFSTLYKPPYNFQDFKLKHLLIIKKLLSLEYNISFFNRRFDVFHPHNTYNTYDKHQYGIQNFNTGAFHWIFENKKVIGELYKKTSEYNDDTGDNITNTYESTCVIFWAPGRH